MIYVIDSRQSTYAIEGGLTGSVQQAREQVSQRMIAEAERHAEEHDRMVETIVKEGNAGDVIIEYAADNDIDHIVMGSHGRSGLSRIVVGSVAETVVRNSPLTVTIAR